MTPREILNEALKWAESGDFSTAAGLYRQVLESTPGDAVALAGLGQCLCWMRETEEGLAHLRLAARKLKGPARKNGDPSALLQLAAQLQHWGDITTSLDLARQAIAIRPGFFNGYHVLSLGLAGLNRTDEALEAALRANRLAPDEPNSAIHRAILEMAGGDLGTARRLLEGVTARFSEIEQPRAYLELGRVLDKAGEYDKAFECLVNAGRGHQALPEVRALDRDFIFRLIERHKRGFVAESLSRPHPQVYQDGLPSPVFLLGFFRSGTTLSQQVMDTHPRLITSDEHDFIYDVRTELARITRHGEDIAAKLGMLDSDGIKHLRRYYWLKVEKSFGLPAKDEVFLDKTTMNSVDIGMIDFLFPDAKVIFALRDPRDILISAFMQSMRPTATTIHLLDWQGAARLYAAVMDLWLQVRPRLRLKYIELRYEDVVTNFRPTYERVFDFLSLDWTDSAHQFHHLAAGKVIATPSFSEVSRPLYQSSVGRWRKYAHYYPIVEDRLSPFLRAFGYPPF